MFGTRRVGPIFYLDGNRNNTSAVFVQLADLRISDAAQELISTADPKSSVSIAIIPSGMGPAELTTMSLSRLRPRIVRHGSSSCANHP